MQLNDDQMRKLRFYLVRNAPIIDRPDWRTSLVLEDEVEYGETDAQGYRNVVVYIERGLGDREDLIRQVLQIVKSVQQRDRVKYMVHLFSFGWDDGKLHHAGRSHDGNYYSNIKPWVDELCALAGTDGLKSPAVIPSLFPLTNPYGLKHGIERDDLLIFLCRNREVSMADSAHKKYDLRIMKHSVWLFCGEEQIDISLGDFTPTLATKE